MSVEGIIQPRATSSEITLPQTSPEANLSREAGQSSLFRFSLEQSVAIVMVIAQKPDLITARLGSNMAEKVAEGIPTRLREGNPLGVQANISFGRERKVWQTRGSGRSRGECNGCRNGTEDGHHGGSRCRRRGMFGIGKLPSVFGVLTRRG